jgi:hypothetical protein
LLPIQPKHPIAVDSEEDITHHINSKGLAEIAEKLGITKRLSGIFPSQPLDDNIHIIVEVPNIGKRERVSVA